MGINPFVNNMITNRKDDDDLKIKPLLDFM